MAGARHWLRGFILGGLRVGRLVHGVGAEARICAVRGVPDRCRNSGAGVCRTTDSVILEGITDPTGYLGRSGILPHLLGRQSPALLTRYHLNSFIVGPRRSWDNLCLWP